jgi:hypothetical protein
MKYFSRILATVGVLSCSLSMSMQTASASPINGTLQLGGTFTIGPTFLNFCPAPGPCPAAPGPWNSPATGTGDLSAYTGDGMITNLSSGTEPVGTLLPGNGIPFLVFTGGVSVGGGSNPDTPTIEFFITEVFAGVGTAANCASGGEGTLCTPTGSAVTLLNGSGGNSSATITAAGLAENLTTGEFDALQIVLTSQFNTTYESVLNTEATFGSITNTFSATFTATSAPEPSSMWMIGIGAGLVLFAARRHKQ